MSLLVRSWNLFHGNTMPAGRDDRLEQMVRLASDDGPDVLCLQEVPPWALVRLAEWSGMEVHGDVARRPGIGPLPVTAGAGGALTAVHRGRLRSFFAGQANAILVGPRLRSLETRSLTLNSWRFRRAQARWLGLPAVARLAWARERRVCQVVRVSLPEGGEAVVGNLHATAYPPDQRLPDAESLRAATFVDGLAGPGGVCILAGDFNVSAGRSWTLREVTGAEWGFAGTGPGIDHLLVRGAPAGPTVRWPDGRRRVDGQLLSDHAPVERRVG